MRSTMASKIKRMAKIKVMIAVEPVKRAAGSKALMIQALPKPPVAFKTA